jgi:hypothetical protein
MELRVYEDRMEVQSAGATRTVVLWYRHVRAVVPSRQDGSEALAIIDRGGEVLLVPMAPDQITTAEWLISGVIEWQSQRGLRAHRTRRGRRSDVVFDPALRSSAEH